MRRVIARMLLPLMVLMLAAGFCLGEAAAALDTSAQPEETVAKVTTEKGPGAEGGGPEAGSPISMWTRVP